MKVLLDENLDHRLRNKFGSHEWRIIKNHLPQITSAIEDAAPGSFRTVDCGTFSRKKIADQ